MNKLLIVLLALALVACEDQMEQRIFQEYQRFIEKYKKNYESIEEFIGRYNVFKQNYLETITNEVRTYELGVTKFSDLTRQEFAKTYLNLNFDAFAMQNAEPYEVTPMLGEPDAYDWRDYGRVSAVKDQGSCGSCWAFSTMANLEGLYYAKKGVMKTFSEQQLVDCDTKDSGCNGGLMEYAFAWLKSNGGFETDTDYPYKGTKKTCSQDTSKFVDMKVSGYKQLTSSTTNWNKVDEAKVKTFLLETGPLCVALNATPLQSYTGGIYSGSSSACSPSSINHAVTLVGYGTENGVDFWSVKNSWGTSWGEKGYFRIKRGSSTCGINYYVMTATVTF